MNVTLKWSQRRISYKFWTDHLETPFVLPSLLCLSSAPVAFLFNFRLSLEDVIFHKFFAFHTRFIQTIRSALIPFTFRCRASCSDLVSRKNIANALLQAAPRYAAANVEGCVQLQRSLFGRLLTLLSYLPSRPSYELLGGVTQRACGALCIPNRRRIPCPQCRPR